MTLKCIGGTLTILTLLFTTWSAHAYGWVDAIWNHELGSSRLVGYKQGEHLVLSKIYTGTPGTNARFRYDLRVKVSTWNKPYTISSTADEKHLRQVLTVTLSPLRDRQQMKATFDHVVYKNGQKKLKFSGVTILRRLS